MHKLPQEASNYIREHFRDGNIARVQTVKNESGHYLFKVDIHAGDIIHHLEFNEKGRLVRHRSDPSFEEDYYEGDFYGEPEP